MKQDSSKTTTAAVGASRQPLCMRPVCDRGVEIRVSQSCGTWFFAAALTVSNVTARRRSELGETRPVRPAIADKPVMPLTTLTLVTGTTGIQVKAGTGKVCGSSYSSAGVQG